MTQCQSAAMFCLQPLPMSLKVLSMFYGKRPILATSVEEMQLEENLKYSETNKKYDNLPQSLQGGFKIQSLIRLLKFTQHFPYI